MVDEKKEEEVPVGYLPKRETLTYLIKAADHEVADDVCELVNKAILERNLSVDATLATVATALAMYLIKLPDTDENTFIKLQWLSFFIQHLVHTHRVRIPAIMKESKDAAHH